MPRVIIFLLLAGCSPPPNQDRLQTYGAVFPVCILACRAAITTADLEAGASQTTTNQASSALGSQP